MFPATGEEMKSSQLVWEQQLCHRFSLAEIRSATQDFDDELIVGQGGFGKVYKGQLENGVGGITAVAIKRLDSMSSQGAPEFWVEIEMLSKLRHCHLVSLIGYCNENPEMILVYEYAPLGTLDNHLHKVSSCLSWVQRLKICIGAARGLDYLHTGTGTLHGIIHRDIKSSNILLDQNWAAKISDFGLSKIGPTNQPSTCVNTAVKGTIGYLDPEYFSTGILTRKSDVYAFGVVLLEVLCGRRAVDTSLDQEKWSLAAWARDSIKDGKLYQIIDARLSGQILPKCLKEFARIAYSCLHSRSKQRPMMAEVIIGLQLGLISQESTLNSGQGVSIIQLTRKVQKFFFSSIGANSDRLEAKASTSRKNNSNNVLQNKDGGILQDAPSDNNFTTNKDFQLDSPNPRIFTYAELVRATNNLTSKLWAEGLGTFYKGWISESTYAPTEDGHRMPITVWMEDQLYSKRRQSKPDLIYVRQYNHPNLANLLGYCSEDEKILYVYDFFQTRSLDNQLHGSLKPLSWVMRLNIAVGAARGLASLHREKRLGYSQFKTSLILLDEDFNAKLSYPEVGKLSLRDLYPFKIDAYYAAPEWYAFQAARVDAYVKADQTFRFCGLKSEVYSFGVVLLEILTGLRVYDTYRPSGKQNLVRWATPLLPDITKLDILVDPRLKDSYPREGAFQLAMLIVKCLQRLEENRPSMPDVVEALEQISSFYVLTVLKQNSSDHT